MDVANLPEDLSSEEKRSVTEFVTNGCPGLVKIDDTKVFKWFELYMSGKSYSEIALLTKDKKDLIMYVSCRSRWHDKRMEYYRDMSTAFAQKLKTAKLASANTVVNAITALSKYHDKKFNEFLINNDHSIIDNLDTKVLGQYYKSLEMLDKLMRPDGEEEKEPKAPTVNIHVPSNSTVTMEGEDTVKINSDDAAGELLKALSKYQRSNEK
jgi:hypothetical protein